MKSFSLLKSLLPLFFNILHIKNFLIIKLDYSLFWDFGVSIYKKMLIFCSLVLGKPAALPTSVPNSKRLSEGLYYRPRGVWLQGRWAALGKRGAVPKEKVASFVRCLRSLTLCTVRFRLFLTFQKVWGSIGNSKTSVDSTN